MAGDSFLSDPSRKRKRGTPKSHPRRSRGPRPDRHDEEISSDSDEPGATDNEARVSGEDGEISSDEEFEQESAADKRRRLAKQYLENLKSQEVDGDDFDAQDLDDDIVARRLQDDVAENKGRMYKFISEKIEQQVSELRAQTTRIGCKNLTGVAAHHPYVYTVSKDMELIKWKTVKGKLQRLRHSKGGMRYFDVNSRVASQNHHCGEITCVAASPDGKFVVTGGKDARLIIWSTESLSCLKVMETRAAVNAITFRKGSDQLYAACADLRVRTYSINQFAQLEILYGHQDDIPDISALFRETCVTVGSRDKTAMFWKIADESRLTFRGGDGSKKRRKHDDDPRSQAEIDAANSYVEGSIEAVAMIDESHFVSGSDNGNVSLWALSKKKALFTQPLAHGLLPEPAPTTASAETDLELASKQVPRRQPYWITSIYAVPYSDFFVSGSYSGEVKLWRVERDNFRSFSLVGTVPLKGCVVKIDGAEIQEDRTVVVYVATSKEHRLGRWLGKVEGRNAVTTLTFGI